jgi:hypothetical protein
MKNEITKTIETVTAYNERQDHPVRLFVTRSGRPKTHGFVLGVSCGKMFVSATLHATPNAAEIYFQQNFKNQ